MRRRDWSDGHVTIVCAGTGAGVHVDPTATPETIERLDDEATDLATKLRILASERRQKGPVKP